MTVDPAHRRRSIRLKGYDYSQAGAYFITICTHNRQPFFGKIVRAGLAPAQMHLNEYGQIAREQWLQIPSRFETDELGEFVVMPNHIHGIIVLNESQTVGAGFTPALGDNTANIGVGAGFTPALNDETPNIGVGAGFTPALNDETPNTRVGASPTPTKIGQPPRVTVGNIVGAYKSIVANECLKIFKIKNETMGKLWQRNYYEHIIRDEKSFLAIAEYIYNNPAQWELDKLYPGDKK